MWKRRLIPGLIGLAVVFLLAWLRVADPLPVQIVREIAFDTYQRLAPRAPSDAPVRIVDVDDPSLAAIGQWPWPRDVLAELTTRLTQLGAAAIVYDVLFSEPDRTSPSRFAATIADAAAPGPNPLAGVDLPDHDAIFAEAIAASPTVLGFEASQGLMPFPTAKIGFSVVSPTGTVRVPTSATGTMPLPILVEAAHGLGFMNIAVGSSVETVREIPLLWSNGEAFYPALAAEGLRLALGVGSIIIFGEQSNAGVVQAVRIGAFEIPTTATGSLRLYYQETQPGLYVPAHEVLGDDWTALAPEVAGNIVIIGTSATGLRDIRGTPLGRDMAGVEIHAQALQQILAGTYLQRADWVSGLEILAFVVIGIALVVIILASGPLLCLIVGGVLVILGIGASWLAFRNGGVLIDPSFTVIGSLVVYSVMIFLQFTLTNTDRRKIRRAFGHYVSPELLVQIEKSGHKLQLGGETRELSILFTDIRNFTTLSEHLQPPQLVALLNTLFGSLGERITDHFGTIDKFMGDAMMAFWNAPLDVDRHALRACTAALGMRRTLDDLNARDAFGLRTTNHVMEEINIGIGISTGEALVGNLGLETRFDYSCIGDSVNVASRVEGACKQVGYDILVVASTREQAAGLAFLEAGSIALKGKSAREATYILVGDAAFAASDTFKALEAAHSRAIGAICSGRDVDKAIEDCTALVTFGDLRLKAFYDKMRGRRADFAGEPAEVPATATDHTH
ncbi:MAG: CHASE2 domain-containing protein [Bauldia sp.]